MFLILSAMTALLECGSVFLGKCLDYSPGRILSLCLAYQIGNLFPIPFCLRRKALLSITYLALIIICIIRLFDTYSLLQWTLYFVEITLLSCAMQSIRAKLKAQTSTVRKRTARIIGFTLAPLMMYVPLLILTICCFTILFSLKYAMQLSASKSNVGSLFKAMIKNDCYRIMLWHQLHYFIYTYAMILIVYQITRKPFLTMLLFACTWLTYLFTEPAVKSVCRCRFKLVYDAKNILANAVIILTGHAFLILILLLLPHMSIKIFIVLWILAGFGGGTVFAISALCGQSPTYTTFTENMGHFIGTAVATVWASFFPQNIRYIPYLSALSVFIVLLLSIKNIVEERSL